MTFSYIQKAMSRVAALLMVLFASTTGMLAETKLYISDFTIDAGETKEVAVNLDTDESTICYVELTVQLPDGLEFVANGNNIKTSIESSRTGGLTIESDNTTGKIIFSDLMRQTAISAGSGPIFYINVKNSGLTDNATISLDKVTLKRQDKTNVNSVLISTATVSIPGGSSDAGAELAFSDNNITVAAGETVSVDVTMENEGLTVDGFQANLTVPEGWTASVTSAKRGDFTFNESTGVILNYTGVSGTSGAIFTLELTAPSSFNGSVQVTLDPIKLTIGDQTESVDAMTLTLNGSTAGGEDATISFAEEEVLFVAGETGNVDVNLTNPATTVQGFQATLDIPEGWNVEVSSSRMANFAYNANTKKLLNYTGVDGEEGVLFTLSLTAPADFLGDATAEIKVKDIKLTVNNATLKLDEITMTAKAKDMVALAELQEEIKKATELLGDDDVTVEPGKALKDAIDVAQAVADKADATSTELKAATEILKAAEETYKAAKAAALAAAKEELEKEIAKATDLLGDDDVTAEPGKALKDAIDVAQAVLDNPDATLEEVKKATETLKEAEEAYKAAKEAEAAALAAAKEELKQEVATATALLADADTTEDPGKALKEAIDAAQAVLDNPKATVEEVKKATETLKAAEEAYKAAKDAEAALAAAKEELEDEIENATALLGDDDTSEEPGKSLDDAIVAAQEVLDDPNATQEEVEAATETLKEAEEAYNAAKEAKAAAIAAAKEELEKEVAKATELLGDADTTEDPGKALKEAIDAAQAVLDDSNVTLEEVEQATQTLKDAEDAYKTTAINALRLRTDSNDAIYNLNGIRVNTMTKGLYIIDGKKIVK